jgi:hypothetical protein
VVVVVRMKGMVVKRRVMMRVIRKVMMMTPNERYTL